MGDAVTAIGVDAANPVSRARLTRLEGLAILRTSPMVDVAVHTATP